MSTAIPRTATSPIPQEEYPRYMYNCTLHSANNNYWNVLICHSHCPSSPEFRHLFASKMIMEGGILSARTSESMICSPQWLQIEQNNLFNLDNKPSMRQNWDREFKKKSINYTATTSH